MKKLVLLAGLCLFSLQATAAKVVISHELGETEVEQDPQRVVVLGVGPLDAIDQLGISPVAVTKFPSTPSYLQKYQSDDYPSAGSLFEPDFENIYMQKPDVIITGPRNAKHYAELSKIAPTIMYSVDGNLPFWQTTQQQWRNLGILFNKQQWVEDKIAKVSAEFSAIKGENTASPKTALMVMSSGGNVSAFGAKSRFSPLFEEFGFKEAVKDIKTGRHGDVVSFEFIQEKNPQVLFILDRDSLVNKGHSTTHEDFDNSLIHATDAYKNGHIVYLDVNAWYVDIAGMHAVDTMLSDIKQVVESK